MCVPLRLIFVEMGNLGEMVPQPTICSIHFHTFLWTASIGCGQTCGFCNAAVRVHIPEPHRLEGDLGFLICKVEKC